MKIIDSFIFFNELELLNYRLEILNEYVDYFIIVESPYTFSGLTKPLYYFENKSSILCFVIYFPILRARG
jgi:beta-1,4-mannosyl-glycoprotein beta-1,4-N-acetylglucosaminyltransferase